MRSKIHKNEKNYWFPILVFMVLIAISIRIYLYAGFIPKDDAEYARVAYQVSEGTFNFRNYEGPAVIPVRTGIILPTALMLRMLGPSEWALAAYPLTLSLLLLLLLFYFTANIFGYTAGLLAVGLWTFLPMELEIATMLWPDLPNVFYSFLGVFLIFVARKADPEKKYWLFIGGIGAGFSFGLAWLCKASVIYFVPFCVLLMIVDMKNATSKSMLVWSGVAAGALTVIGVESAVYFAKTGNWLFRLNEIERNYRQLPEWFYGAGSRFGYPEGMAYLKAVLKRVLKDGPAIIFLNSHYLYLPLFGLIASLHAVVFKDKRFYFMMFLFVTMFVMFNFASSSLSAYKPLPLFNRYYYPLCFPAAVLIAGLVSKMLLFPENGKQRLENHERLFWGCILAAALIIITGYSTFRHIRDRSPTWSSAERAIAGLIGPETKIYTDPLSQNGLEFFWKYPDQMNIINYGELPSDADCSCGSYVLINESYNNWLKINVGMWLNQSGFSLPERFQAPPGNWKIVWRNLNAVLYRVVC